MKNRFDNVLEWIIGGGIIVIFIILMAPKLLFSTKIIKDDLVFANYCVVIIAATVLTYVIVVSVKIRQFKKYEKAYKEITIQKVKNELTLEFKPVILKYSGVISKEKFECQAKVNKNGKIICKIYTNFETKFDSYEEFLKYFHFKEE